MFDRKAYMVEYMKKWRQKNRRHVKQYKKTYEQRLREQFVGVCKCGCGGTVKGYNDEFCKPNEYIHGHNPTTQPVVRGAAHRNWKGGWINSQGYRVLTVYENGKRRTQLEHRIIAEKILGRKLSRSEHVHHIDGNKANNDPSNLVVLPARTHHLFHKRGIKYEFQALSGSC